VIEGSGKDTMAELEKFGEGNPVSAVHPPSRRHSRLDLTLPERRAIPRGFCSPTATGQAIPTPVLNSTMNSMRMTAPSHFYPWAHTYGQGEMHTFLSLGASLGFMESPATLVDDMAQVKPTFLLGRAARIQ